MNSSRHTDDRISLNKKRAVSIIYQLCYGLSQRCIFLQEDNGLFLRFCNLSQRRIETQRQLGTSCSSNVISRNRTSIASSNLQSTNGAIQDAIRNQHLVTLMIDDYHNIHAIRRPDSTQTSQATHMGTIIIKVVKEAKGIPIYNVNSIHNPVGIDADLLVNNLCSVQTFQQISSFSFASLMPEFTSMSFDPLRERHNFESHDYQAQDIKSMR